MNILAVMGSPRKGSNTAILAERFLAGAASESSTSIRVEPWKKKVSPCIACEGCYKTGRCVVKDDFQELYDLILGADALLLATPIYFGAVSAQVKSFIDRGQCFWAMRDIVKAPMPPGPAGGQRKGILIATSGLNLPIMFQGARTTFTFLLRSMQGEVWAELLYGGYDDAGQIRDNPSALDRAFELGRRLALGMPAEE